MINYKVSIPRYDLNKVIDNVLKLDSINDKLWAKFGKGDRLERERDNASLISQQLNELTQLKIEFYKIDSKIDDILNPYLNYDCNIIEVLSVELAKITNGFEEIIDNELYYGYVSYIDLSRNFLIVYALLRLIGDELK